MRVGNAINQILFLLKTRALRFLRGFLFIARVFVECLRMYVEVSAALKLVENFLFC